MPLNHSDLTLTEKQTTAVCDGGKIVVLTPDDIITLKLARDQWLRMATIDTETYAPNVSRSQIFETLERILKQVG